jgi:hypothetical protein
MSTIICLTVHENQQERMGTMVFRQAGMQAGGGGTRPATVPNAGALRVPMDSVRLNATSNRRNKHTHKHHTTKNKTKKRVNFKQDEPMAEGEKHNQALVVCNLFDVQTLAKTKIPKALYEYLASG